MSLIEQHDAAAVLDEWTNRVANLPNEIAFMYEEIEQKDKNITECLATIAKHDLAIQNWVRKNGGHITYPKENIMNKIIKDNYDRAQVLQSEKIALAQKCQIVVDKHIRNLDSHIKALQDRGEFPICNDLPSLLRDQPVLPASCTATAAPLGQTPTTAHNRLPNQSTQIAVPPHIQSQKSNGNSLSIATTPLSIGLTGRQGRELSNVGNKRQNIPSNLSTYPSSNLARQSSLGPGSSKSTTPTIARAGSAGPKTQMKLGPKKVAPNGSKPGGIGRKLKKSGLSRVKRTGNKNPLSPTHDSELSDADSGSVHEEDEARTPKRIQHRDGDEKMVEIEDDDDGADNRKYCTCQSVSYGDMVACDNPRCEYEWFHWSCVELKSEPLGTWICAACKAAGFRK